MAHCKHFSNDCPRIDAGSNQRRRVLFHYRDMVMRRDMMRRDMTTQEKTELCSGTTPYGSYTVDMRTSVSQVAWKKCHASQYARWRSNDDADDGVMEV